MANENELIPLYYAIIKHFLDGTEACANDVVTALSPNYGNYKYPISYTCPKNASYHT